ncbi:YceI family protein [Variovorax rhizosphaerae]|uniref:YceI family protein n=1 Tax=Variovorax rhizosphaerae TaxID=1836200 RepID=A0ABU8WK42_9BURK
MALLVAACAQPSREAGVSSGRVAPVGFPAQDYAQAAAQGKRVYRVDASRSLVVVTVRRAGSLARLGHDHVVASRSVQGFVMPDAGRADLYIPLSELTVDEPDLRVEAALDTQPAAADIGGTRDNMHVKVLETQRFPFVLIRVRSAGAADNGAMMDIAITLHGVEKSYVVPVSLRASRDELSASGQIEFNQSDFGIVPFSVLGGALQVQDRLALRFVVRASGPQE